MKHNKWKRSILLCGITLSAFIIRILFFDKIGADFDMFLKIWINQLQENPFLANTEIQYCNYTSLYILFLRFVALFENETVQLYLIKTLSIAFDFLCGWVAYKIIFLYTSNEVKSIIGYAATLFLPTLIINGSYINQCDSIYVFFLLYSFYQILNKKWNLVLILFGFAISLKLQSIFFLPIVGLILFLKKIQFKQLFIIPFIYFLTCIPDILLSKSFTPFFMYSKQTNFNELLVSNTMSIFNLLCLKDSSFVITSSNGKFNFLSYLGILIVIFVTLIILLIFKGQNISINKLFNYTLFFSIFTPFFLPYMHERYYLFAELLCVIFIILNPLKNYIFYSIEIFSLFHYFYFIHYYNLLFSLNLLSIIEILVISILLFLLLQGETKNNVKSTIL